MMKFNILGILMVLAFAKADSLQAQDKREKESRIERKELPVAALEMIDKLSAEGRRTRFYKEIDGEKRSFEMKTKVKGKWRSAEFNKEGALEDVEVDVRKRHIADEARVHILKTLDSINPKNRIEKVQKQYLPMNKGGVAIDERLNTGDFDNYEIIAAFKNSRKIYRMELLFNRSGQLISSRLINRIQYDFLLF
jgi:hypothetical protein